MKVYLVWESEPYEFEGVVKVYKNEVAAKEFIKHRDKMTGCTYRIEEKKLE